MAHKWKGIHKGLGESRRCAHCSCGWTSDWDAQSEQDMQMQYVDHRLDALPEPRVLVIYEGQDNR